MITRACLWFLAGIFVGEPKGTVNRVAHKFGRIVREVVVR